MPAHVRAALTSTTLSIPVLNGAIKADSGVGLPETELDLEARAQSWILGQESRETWP